jgi:hypothetical protein
MHFISVKFLFSDHLQGLLITNIGKLFVYPVMSLDISDREEGILILLLYAGSIIPNKFGYRAFCCFFSMGNRGLDCRDARSYDSFEW